MSSPVDVLLNSDRFLVQGTYWGEKGWFRVVRGVNSLDIEKKCSWAVPKDGGFCFSAHGNKKC